MQSKNTEALNTFKKGISFDSKNVLCRYYSGLVYIALKDKTNATKMYTELKDLEKKHADMLLERINKM